MTNLASTWTIRPLPTGGHEVLIDGEPVPWDLSARGPRVEPLDRWSILWLPVLVDQPCPGHGPPDAEAVMPAGTDRTPPGIDQDVEGGPQVGPTPARPADRHTPKDVHE